jgi:hypothetical protein
LAIAQGKKEAQKGRKVMKTQKVFTLIAMLALVAGCAKPKNQIDTSATTTTTNGTAVVPGAPSLGSNSSLLSGGSTVAFTPVSMTKVKAFWTKQIFNNPTNFKVNVNMGDNGNGHYEGDVTLSYVDNGQTLAWKFSTGTGKIGYSTHDQGKDMAVFNVWFQYQGKKVFHAFLEDSQSALVLVIDDTLDLHDGGGITSASGSIWFKNFGAVYANQYLPCWATMTGPYNCRTWQVAGDEIDTTAGVYPQTESGYQKLGSFTGLDVTKALTQ